MIFHTNESVSNDTSPEKQRSEGYRFRGLVIGLIVMVGLAASWRWTPLREWVDLHAVTAAAVGLRANPLAPLIIVAAFLVASLILFPASLLIMGSAFVMGSTGGFIYSLIGCLLGAAVTYGLGQMLGHAALSRMAGSRIDRVNRNLAKHGILTMTAVRLLPIAPFTIVNMVAGASHIRFWDYILGTAMGLTPAILALTLFERQMETAVREPGSGGFLIFLLLGVVLFLCLLVLRRWGWASINKLRGNPPSKETPPH